MKISKKIEAEILHFMDEYWGSYLNGDLHTWASYLPDDYRNIGTTKAEIWNSKKEIVDFTEKVLDQMVGMAEARNKKTQIIPYDPYVMVHELGDLFVKAEEGWVYYAPIRLSSLLEKTAEGWKILHQHGSYPDSKTEEGETFGFDELKIENKKLRDAIQAHTIELERKNRELEIEAALERVRARSMAMRHTSEIQEVIHTVHEELLKLNISIQGGSFIVVNADIDTELLCWGAGGTANTSELIHVPHFGMPFCTNLINGIKQGSGFFTEEFTQQEKKDYFTELFKHHPWSELDSKQQQETLHSEGGYTRSCCVAEHTSTFIINQSGRKFSDEENDILKRFSKVFEQTYTRFLDLQKAEAQAREAQIELAMERVRARSMAMHRSEELSDVVALLFEEIKPFGFASSGIELILPDEYNDILQFWMTSTVHNKVAECFNIPRTIHPFFQKTWKAWKDQLPRLILTLEGEEKKKFDSLILTKTDFKQLPEEVKQFILNSGYQDVFSSAIMKHGLLESVDTEPISEEQFVILERFAKVFEQTYTRFLDLQKAETQAREAQIEAALERVRSRSMAMHESSEMAEVVALLYEQIQVLGFTDWGSSIIICDEEAQVMRYWYAEVNLPHLPDYCDVPLTNKIVKKTWELWQSGIPQFDISLLGKEKDDYTSFMLNDTDYNHILSEDVKEEWRKPKDIFFSYFTFKYGLLEFVDIKTLDKEKYPTYQRFTQVFEQTYTRFLDLQKAEVQAREAQIEAALERVRAQTMAMHSSEDVGKCIVKMFSEVTALGVPESTRFGIGILNHDNENNQLWTASKDGEEVKMHIGNIEMSWHPLLISARKAWKAQVPLHEYVLEGEDLLNYYQMLNDAPDYPLRIAMENLPERQFHYGFVFEHGFFYAFSPREFQPDLIRIIQRFTSLFGQTYRRYLDLVKAEAQAREAKIEAALEKVRSRTMAMRKADELHEVVTMIVERLMDLGVILDANGVILCTYFPDSKDVLHWIASPDFSFTGSYLLPYFDHPIFSAAWESRLSGVDYWSKSFSVEEKNSFFEYAFEHSDYKKFPDDFKQWVFQNDKHSLSFAWTENAAILIPSHTGVVPAAEDVEILKRFANVFEQAYVRFMDLQTKEEQAAKILEEKQRLEKTLHDLRTTQKQLVQSEKLASLGELTAGIAHEIQNPLNFVNNFAEMSVELAEELKEEIGKLLAPLAGIPENDKEYVGEILSDLTQNQQKINHHGKRAAAIVTGMLQHARTSTGTKEPTDLNALADEYLRLSYHGLRAKDSTFNAKMVTDFDPAVGMVDVIPQDIGRVFLNIINNAFYATQQRRLGIRKLGIEELGDKYEPTVSISSKMENGQVVFKIKDNGTGIPDDVKAKIFQPFFTTKPTGQGTGLGLSLAYDIVVKGHGGVLEVETKEGESTEFIIFLPKQTKK